ncbi:MAG TPA: PCYCGC motif-containing (lipo)protein [Candidatus Bilamarchaeaceae archaeon]|nr:PCYCGC motif-containing (lipo)protein [Candidatus Bilamarchaeaceae archaeon]
MGNEKIIGIVVVLAFVVIIAYFFLSSETAAAGQIPDYVTGETREIYEWAKTPEGAALLEQIPCYCGCRYEGHLHSRHCFWRDDGSFDKHGITCSVCLDIGRKAREMHEEGADICEIRNAIDEFYAPNAHLGTETPMPEGCTA